MTGNDGDTFRRCSLMKDLGTKLVTLIERLAHGDHGAPGYAKDLQSGKVSVCKLLEEMANCKFSCDDMQYVSELLKEKGIGLNPDSVVNYDDIVYWTGGELDIVSHRKQRLRGVKIFETMGGKELEETAKALERVVFNDGENIIEQGEEGLDCFIVDQGQCYALVKIGDEWKEVKQYYEGGFFGERALLRKEPRAASVVARGAVSVLRLSRDRFVQMMEERNGIENLIRGAAMFETMTDEQIAKLGGALKRMNYSKGEDIILQGEEGNDFFLMERGECVASVRMPDGSRQDVKTYNFGEVFGEKALLEKAPRSATVTAATEVTVLTLSRDNFEANLGPLNQLKTEQYLSDPRKLIADFYRPGDARGPAGALDAQKLTPDESQKTSWFVVYRPCSRDSIAKMLGKVGVGKGLNIKGKSAKRNRLSGFVPFIQISDNKHKTKVEDSPPDARTIMYYRNSAARETARKALLNVLNEETGLLKIKKREILDLDHFAPEVFGLDVPEPLMKEVYIMRPDLSPMVGWETGRASEPAFMDMNLHATRGSKPPKVVLYQYDLNDPMNPLGLLVAYQEKLVRPVVSDFDTFTVGSTGMKYEQVPENQQQILDWSLGHCEDLIQCANSTSWTGRWLEILSAEASKGFHPEIPKYGFGDPTSVGLIQHVVNTTAACGAVRHGAECFNYYFPQELDDEFLVIWDGFPSQPWEMKTEPELREFLLARAGEGYSMPLNPVWTVRDPGWYDVLQALRNNEMASQTLGSWFNEKTLEQIDEMHEAFPEGFVVKKSFSDGARKSVLASAQDCTGEEIADFVRNEVLKKVRARWRRIRFSLRMMAKAVAATNAAESTPAPPPPPAPPSEETISMDAESQKQAAQFKLSMMGLPLTQWDSLA